MKVLIVEDEKQLAESICAYLANESYVCERASDFRTAWEKIEVYDYACIVLDINLPGGNGLEILKELKKQNKLDGVLITSARNSIDDKVHGLRAGADDYLTKPYYLPELAARIDAIIRRKSFGGSNFIRFEQITVELDSRRVTVGEKALDLTRKEFELLIYLISNKEKVISKNAIATYLWGDNMDINDNYDFIYTHIKNLRKKLLQAGADDYIQSLYGVGYKLTAL